MSSEVTLYSALNNYVQTPKGFQRLVVQTGQRTLEWIAIVSRGLSKTGRVAQRALGRANHALYYFDLPGDFKSFCHSVQELKENALKGAVFESAKKVIWVATYLALVVGQPAGSIMLISAAGWITLTNVQTFILEGADFFSLTALFLLTAVGIKKQVDILSSKQISSSNQRAALLTTAVKVLFISKISMLILAVVFGAPVVAHWVIVSTATLYLILVLTEHFYKELRC